MNNSRGGKECLKIPGHVQPKLVTRKTEIIMYLDKTPKKKNTRSNDAPRLSNSRFRPNQVYVPGPLPDPPASNPLNCPLWTTGGSVEWSPLSEMSHHSW